MEHYKIPEINLLPAYKRQSPIVMMLFLLLCLVIIGLLGFLIFDYFSTKSENEMLDTQISSKEAELEALKVGETETVGANKVTLTEAVEIAEYFVIPTAEVIDDIIERIPPHGYLSEYNYDDGVIQITNEFETLNFVSAYVDSLLQSNYLQDVKTGKVEEFDVADRIDEDNAFRYYKIIPRYQTMTELTINRDEVKEEGETDE